MKLFHPGVKSFIGGFLLSTKLITHQYHLQKWAKIIVESNANGMTIHFFVRKRTFLAHIHYFLHTKSVRPLGSFWDTDTFILDSQPQDDEASTSMPSDS